MFTIERNYAKRETEKSDWSGEVGKVTLVVDAPAKGEIAVSLNGTELPQAGVEHLLHFALQTLQDAYAGAKTLAEAQGAWALKLDRIAKGTIGVRFGGGDSVSETLRIQRQLVFDAVRAAARKAEGKTWKDSAKKAEIDAMGEEAWNAKLDAAFAKNEAHFVPLVAAEMERLAEARKTKAEARNVVLDI